MTKEKNWGEWADELYEERPPHNPLLGPPEAEEWRGSGADLLTAEFPDQHAIVEGFSYPGGLSSKCGEGAIGKTWASMQLARCVALGIPWFGLRTEKCRVGMISLEGTGGRYQERFLAMPGDRAWMNDVVIRCPGFPPGMTSFWDVCDTTLRGQLIEFIQVYELGLLILDPLVHFRNLLHHENDTQHATEFIHALGVIRNVTGVAIVILHHPPKGGTGGRGNTVLRNEYDAEISLEGVGPITEYSSPGGRITLDWTKAPRHGPKPDTIHLIRGPMGMLEQTDEKPVSTGVQKRRDDEAVLLEALRDGPRSVKELQTRAYELGMLPVTTNTFRDRAKALAKKGRIHSSGGTRGNPLVFWRIDGEPRNQIEENQDVVLDSTPEEIEGLDA